MSKVIKIILPLCAIVCLLAGCTYDGQTALSTAFDQPTFIYGILKDYFEMSVVYACGIVVLAIGLAFVFYTMEKKRRNGFWDFLERKLYVLFFIVWAFGFCVYLTGMFILKGGGAAWTMTSVLHMLGVAPMAIIHAFEMFMLQSDISAVHEEWHGNVVFMTLYSSVHVMAALVSMMFVIKHFGYNFMASVRLWLAAKLARPHEKLFVFWGMNEASYLLAKDIEDSYVRNYNIVFVKTADEDDNNKDRSGLERVFSLLSMSSRDLDKYKTLRCYSTNALYRLSEVNATDTSQHSAPSAVLRTTLGLRALVKLIRSTKKEVHFFLLGNDEDRNIKATANLCCDVDIRKALKSKQVKIYSHARVDSIKRVVEDINYKEPNLEVRVLDSAYLSVESLKECKAPLTHPVHFVDVERDATVSSPFRAMIVGLGECGSDAVRFLYEHGAFVSDSRDVNGHVMRSPFVCDVFDPQMDSIAPQFRHMHPGLSISKVLHDYDPDEKSLIRLYQAGSRDEMFWSFVDENIARENYIVIAVMDDEAGITLAVRLLKQAIRMGNDLKRLRIFVRSYSHELLPHIEKIANYYNRSVADSLGLTDINPEPICIFGRLRDVYTYANIIDDRLRRESYVYFNGYIGVHEPEKELGNAWRARRQKEMRGPNGQYWNLNSVRRKEAQDAANAMHRNVKLELMRKALGSEQRLHELAELLTRGELKRDAQNVYAGGSEYQAILDTLAQTEHLRWNASHEVMGYVRGEAKNEIRFTHECLTDWELLSTDEIRGYDYEVVEKSLQMYLQQI